MFTQCPKCETIFRLSAEVLRAAGGQVRCGRCGEVFNALARLAEDAAAFPKGESPLELEARADAILHSVEAVAPAETAAAPGPEVARLEVLDAPTADDDDAGSSNASLEFTLPPGELDRIFVETSPAPLKILAASLQAVPRPVSGLEVPEAVRQEMLAGLAAPPSAAGAAVSTASGAAAENSPAAAAPDVADMLAVRRRGVPFAAWIAAAIVLAALLALQVVGMHGDWPWLSARGGDPKAELAAYQLRQWGVTGDPGANGTLRVRASILNASAQLQPYPLLRVTLADRFGTRVGQRDFGPGEYLGKQPVRLFAPGEHIDATLDIQDPGKDAEGFEIDVCLRSASQRIYCAADAGSAPK